jgi:hypothetical protein
MTLNRDDLIREYAYRIVDGMDMDTLVSWAIDTLAERLEDLPDEDLRNEIADYYPDLLEEN